MNLMWVHLRKGLAGACGTDMMGKESHEDSGLVYGREQKTGIVFLRSNC